MKAVDKLINTKKAFNISQKNKKQWHRKFYTDAPISIPSRSQKPSPKFEIHLLLDYSLFQPSLGQGLLSIPGKKFIYKYNINFSIPGKKFIRICIHI